MIAHNYRRASGFTLIELLVVIGIILVLVGIASYAFTRLDPTERATKINMENAKGMFSELEAFAGYGEIQRINNIDPVNNDINLINAELYRSMRRVPAAQAAMAKLGPKQISTNSTTGLPQLLDGWGSPIVYYPVSIGVTVNTGKGTTAPQTIRSPDGRPFFASAGPDGSMGNGDDNIYSFQL